MPPHEDEAIVGVHVALVVLRQAEVILDLLVRRDAADEQKVDEVVVEQPVERWAARRVHQPAQIECERHHPGRAEAQVHELSSVVLRHPQGQVRSADQGRELLTGERRQAEQRRVVRRKKRGGCHVVILEDAPPLQSRERFGHRRRKRVMEDGQVAVSRPPIVEGQYVVFELLVDGQRVDVRLMPHLAQEIAHVSGAVADGIPLVRRRNPLIDPHASCSGSARSAEGRSFLISSSSSRRSN